MVKGMDITITCYKAEDFAKDYGLEEMKEDFGEDVVKLFYASDGEEDCPFVGVLCEDGSCNVYGLNTDEEYVTFGRMMERLVGYFVEEA